jgi:uncharacterized membrane protein
MADPTPTTPQPGFDLNRPTIIGLLMAASYFTGITAIIAVVLCYVWRGEAHEPWEASHYEYHIRTFWVFLLGAVIGTILLIVLIGFLIWAAVGIWALVRVIVQLINAQKRAPMPDPTTWLI